jgi:hypothetical protein
MVVWWCNRSCSECVLLVFADRENATNSGVLSYSCGELSGAE